jgi:cytochrome c peroxidase
MGRLSVGQKVALGEELTMEGMRMKPVWSIVIILSLFGLAAGAADLRSIEQLGKALLFDTNLSTPRGQSCAS